MEHFEQSQHHPEQGREQQTAAERSVELHKIPELGNDTSAESSAERVDNARRETEAFFSTEAGSEHKTTEPHGMVRAIKHVSNQERRAAYAATMLRIRTEMSSPARAFSRFIHNGGVEKVSTAVGQSIARPNAVLSGSTSALIVVSIVYVIAKIFGYPLSGFETIGAFVVGWTIGLIYDYARAMITGRS